LILGTIAVKLYGQTGGVQIPPLTTPAPDRGYNSYKGPSAACGTFVDPVFGTTVMRMTADRAPDDIYAHNSLFNADGTRFAHGSKIINVATCTVTHTVPRGNATGDAGFHPTDPDLWLYNSGSQIKAVRLLAGGQLSESVYYTASGTISSLGQSVNWFSADGAYFIVAVGSTIRVVDAATMTPLGGSITFNAGSGWAGITPAGNFVVGIGEGQGGSNMNGLSWKIDKVAKTVGAKNIFWKEMCGDHAWALSASDGKDYGVMSECNNTDKLFRVPLDLNAANMSADQQMVAPGVKELLAGHPKWRYGKHFATAAKGSLRDWAFISTECDGGCPDNFNSVPTASTWLAYQQEIVAVNVLTLEVKRLAHHRSRSLPNDYAYQPRLTASWGGEYVCWASNFNVSSPGGVDIYCALFNAAPPVPPTPDTTAPTVSIVMPMNGSTVVQGVPVSVVLNATDNVAVASTELKLDGVVKTSPLVFTTLGSATITAQAQDTSGNLSSIASVSVNVVEPPPAPITLPPGTYAFPSTQVSDPRVLAVNGSIAWVGPGRVVLRLTAAGVDYEWRVTGTTAQAFVAGSATGAAQTVGTGTDYRLKWTGTSVQFVRNSVVIVTRSQSAAPAASATLNGSVVVR
jgi:hypothetical protein